MDKFHNSLHLEEIGHVFQLFVLFDHQRVRYTVHAELVVQFRLETSWLNGAGTKNAVLNLET